MLFRVFFLLCFRVGLLIDALWSPAGKGLTSWLSFVVSIVKLTLSHWYPQVWCLIVSIFDLCPLSYFEKTLKGLEKSLNFTIYRRIQLCLWRPNSIYEGHPINRENFLIMQAFVPLEHGKCNH